MNAQVTAQVEAPVTNKARTVRAPTPKLAFRVIGRPGAGASLYAHTAAVFELLGMFKGAKIPRATLAQIIGDTAVKYHLTKTYSLDWDANGLSLHDGGKAYFKARAIDPELKAAWLEVLTTGKTNDKVCKNQTNIKAM